MCDENEVKRISLADFRKLLETGKIASVVVEILGEFVPDEDDGFQIVRLDDALDPVGKISGRHTEGLDLPLSRNFKDLLHQGVKCRAGVGSQLLNNCVDGIAAEKIGIAALDIDAEALDIARKPLHASWIASTRS